MAVSAEWFDELQRVGAADGPEASLEHLAAAFRDAKRYHDLFDVRVMQNRLRMRLPVDRKLGQNEDTPSENAKLEDADLAACREVGRLLLAEGRLRDAWMYLQASGDRQAMGAALAAGKPREDDADQWIQLGLHEGLAPVCGVRLVLEHYGTCNAITTLEGVLPTLPLGDQQACAAVMVEHLHAELRANVAAHIEQQGEAPSADATISELIVDRPWLFDGGSYHVDTSHLGSVVRFARIVTDPATVDLAWDLTQYGRRLDPQLQYPGEEPFTDVYRSHGLLFGAMRGRDVDPAVSYFRQRAERTDCREIGTGPVEAYLILLCRLERYDDAMEAYAALVPVDVRLSPYAPTLLDIARWSGRVDRYLEICRQREDPIAFAAGLVDLGG